VDNYPQADLEYCKGCGICVSECWTGCIALKEEKE
jgi:Pyruvate/2-oxoacid:ferredoxin oxidoreductase delta subunit